MFELAGPMLVIAIPMFEAAGPMLEIAIPMFEVAIPMFEVAGPMLGIATPMFEVAIPMFKIAIPMFEVADSMSGSTSAGAVLGSTHLTYSDRIVEQWSNLGRIDVYYLKESRLIFSCSI
jgi:hypothetical protein